MATRPRDIGTAAESAVVRYLRNAGFPHAERRSLRGTLDAGDITGTPGLAWEVKGGAAAKGASDGLVAQWLADTERERLNARAGIGVLVLARSGIGPANAGRWWAVLQVPVVVELLAGGEASAWWRDRAPALGTQPTRVHLSTAVRMLHVSGYGTQPERTPELLTT